MNLVNRLSHLIAGSYSNKAFPSRIGISIPEEVRVNDISFWQDDNSTPAMPDFQIMKANGARGVIIRAGQGNWADEDFILNYEHAKGILPRGIYWLVDSRYTPTSQAQKLAGLIASHGLPEMEVFADYEDANNGAYAGWRHLSVFLSECERLIPGVKMGIYSGYYYWLDHSPNPLTESASLAWFKRFPLWLAWYTTNQSYVKVPKPWDSLLYWQRTSHADGTKAGVESLNIDESIFNGSLVDFNTRYHLTDTTPIPPTPEVDTVSLKSIVPEPSVETTVTVTVNSQDYILKLYPPSVPPTPAPTFPHLYRIKGDHELPSWQRPPGPDGGIRNGLPSTVRLQGGKGTVLVPAVWMHWIYRIQGNPNYQFISMDKFADRIGWHNSGEPNKVEQVVFSWNVLEVTRISGERAYIKTVSTADNVPMTLVMPMPTKLHPLIHNFSIQYSDDVDMSTNNKYARTIVFSNPGEELWIETLELERLA